MTTITLSMKPGLTGRPIFYEVSMDRVKQLEPQLDYRSAQSLAEDLFEKHPGPVRYVYWDAEESVETLVKSKRGA